MTDAAKESKSASEKPAIDEEELLRGDLTPLISGAALGARFVARGFTRVRVEGAIDAIPREGPVILASNHISNADARDHRRVADAEARPADPLARQARDVRLADRRLDGPQRRHHPGRPRRGGRRGIPAGPAGPRRGRGPDGVPGGHAVADRRAPAPQGRPRDARAAVERDGSCRSASRTRTRSGRRAGPSRRSAATRRCGWGSRSGSRTSCRRASTASPRRRSRPT